MGIRGELVTLPPPLVNVTIISSTMRIIILLGCCLLSVWAQKCPQDSVNVKQFYKYTVTEKKNGKIKPVADAPCWFDLTRNNCGRCKNKGKQCGAPMQKWCQNPKSKNGCQGVPGNKYTLSTVGAPCYWDPSSKDCAWCKSKTMKQCGPTSYSDKCGSICATAKNKKCDGNLFDCTQIPYCGEGAKCDTKSKMCKCNSGLTGNGQQCFEGCGTGNCTLVVNQEDAVEVSISASSQFFLFARGSGEL